MDLAAQQFKADFFKALAHPLRIRILELLGQGDKNVNELQELIGSEGSAISQQLAVLRNRNIVRGTKDGNKVTYSLCDPMLMELLDITKRIFSNHWVNAISMLDKLKEE